MIHALFAGSEYQLYRCLIAEHRLANGTANVWLPQGLALGYVLLPTAIGSAIGWGHKRHHKWSILLVGATPGRARGRSRRPARHRVDHRNPGPTR